MIVDALGAACSDVTLSGDAAAVIAATQPRHAAHRQPTPAPGSRRRRGARARRGRRRTSPPRRSTLFGVDEYGLDKIDRRILGLLCGQFASQPVGLTTLAHACGEETATIEDAYEPYLLREGLLIRTPRGRVATERAYRAPRADPSRRRTGLGGTAPSD